LNYFSTFCINDVEFKDTGYDLIFQLVHKISLKISSIFAFMNNAGEIFSDQGAPCFYGWRAAEI